METRLKILILEDSADDLDLIERELKRGGIDFTAAVVKKKDEYEQALHAFQPDIILSDHSLPQFNSIEAMQLWKEFQRQHDVSIPFILITGSVSEEFAVQSIKAGADDYILKDRLRRLPSSIKSALERTKLERERKKYLSEIIAQSALMEAAEELAHFGSWQVDLITGKHQWSAEAFRIFGFTPGETEPSYENLFRNVHPDDKDPLKQTIDHAIAARPFQECEFRIVEKDQRIKNFHSKILVKRNEQGCAYQLTGFALDVTQQTTQTRALEIQNQKLIEIAWVQSHEVRAPLARIMGLIQLLKTYPEEKLDLKESMSHILQSAQQLDEIIRRIVRKTEEIV